MQLKKGDMVEVNIETLAFGGRGMGSCHIPDDIALNRSGVSACEGMKTFVPNTIPGDRVRAALTKLKKGYFEADLESIVTPSSLRIEPRCKHFDQCGGCVWQFLAYEDQLKFKAQQVRETLTHLGGFSQAMVESVMRPILGCKDPWNYRNKMEFSFDHPEGGQVMLGLHLPGRRYDVFDLEECHLPGGIFAEIVREVRDFVRKEGLEVYNEKTQDGLLRNLMIREGKNTGEVMVNLVTSINSWKDVDRFTTLFTTGKWEGRIHSLIWTTVMQARGVPTWRESQVLFGQPVIHETLQLENGSSLEFEIAPEAFFQTNTKQTEVLYGQVIELAELTGKEVVYDLYCGTGTIGLFCAHAAKKVMGIEVVKQAVENARHNARRNGITNAEFVVGGVEKLLGSKQGPHHLDRADVVIVDPPRAGLHPDVPEKVAALEAPKLVYVSCNPTTLARDLRQFQSLGYKMSAVRPVDMFPHTSHIETVVLLERAS